MTEWTTEFTASKAGLTALKNERHKEFLEVIEAADPNREDPWFARYAEMVRTGDYARESVRVLAECGALQVQKDHDYQNAASSVRQAMHYRRGVSTIFDMIWQKLLRARSIIEAYEADSSFVPSNEALEDTFRDAINYLSFAISYMRGKMDGQELNVGLDAFNRPVEGNECSSRT